METKNKAGRKLFLVQLQFRYKVMFLWFFQHPLDMISAFIPFVLEPTYILLFSKKCSTANVKI